MSKSKSAAMPGGRSIYLQVLIAIVLGAAIGHFFPKFGESLKPLGDAFIKLVKMIIAPVIFITVAAGIAHLRDMRRVGALAGKAMAYFIVVSSFALALGLIVANVIQPGAGMKVDPATLDAKAVADYVSKSHDQTVLGFAMNIIPKTFVGAFAEGEILQVLLIAVLFGIALAGAGECGRPALAILDSIGVVFFRFVALVMKAAPLGAFGAFAFTIGKYGIASIASLATLVATFYLTSITFVVIVLGAVAALHGFSIFRLIAYLKEELLLVLGTSSSEAALPSLMEKMERAGCSKSAVGVVTPLGYSFNLDGTNIYLTLAALFIAQAVGAHLSLQDQLLLFGVAILSSKGAAGVTGAGFITLAATLAVVPSVPVAGMALILGVDRFMSECRALTNFVGNATATIVVARWEKDLDKDKLRAALHGAPAPIARPPVEADED